jgi:hypothetical protein
MMLIFTLFFAVIAPGFIATLVYEIISRQRIGAGYRFIITSLIFDLIILIINLIGMYIFKSIFTVDALMVYFNCLSFTVKYMLIGILDAIILGVIAGLIFRTPCFRISTGCK